MTETMTQDIAWMRGVIKQLPEQERIEVFCADTTRTLSVCEEAEYVDREPYRHNGLILSLEGYGTDYTLEIPAAKYNKHARLLYPSCSGLGETVKAIRPVGDYEFSIVSDRTAADLGIPRE